MENRVISVSVNGQAAETLDVKHLDGNRRHVIADFHCVTTWSHQGLEWQGVPFESLFHLCVGEAERGAIEGVVFKAQDGNKTSMRIDDLLASDALLADTLNNQPLTVEHGAPLRLVVPNHYGYKNLKHVSSVHFHSQLPAIKRGIAAFLDHPRGRVWHEERSRWIPGRLLRPIYRPLIKGAVRDFHKAM